MSDVDEELPPADAFYLVGHELRFRILDELSRADGALAFSELRERAGVEDPGRFNYHLGELTNRFVRDTEDGYDSTTAGDRVVGAVRSGGLTKTADMDAIPVDAECSNCGTGLDLTFEDGRSRVVCDDCHATVFDVAPPPGVFEGTDLEDVPFVVDRWSRHTVETLDYGFCLHCQTPIDATLRPEGAPGTPDWVAARRFGAAVEFVCERCESGWITSLPPILLRRPPVVAFYYDHGVTDRDEPTWLDSRAEDSVGRVVSRDPLRVEVTFHCDGDELAVTVDDALDVVAAERS